MTTRSALMKWDEFFFSPSSALPVAVFRILFGCIVLGLSLLLRPDLLDFFGPHALVRPSTTMNPAYPLSAWLQGCWSEGFVFSTYAVFSIACVTLTVGLYTRTSAAVVFVYLVVLHFRNGYVMSASDVWIRLSAFYLIFSPAGWRLSVDCRLDPTLAGRPCWPWVQRLLQLQVSIVYLTAFMHKVAADTWLDGTAIYYASRLEELGRFPTPYLFDHLWSLKMMTWGSLLVEFGLGVLVWFEDVRYFVLAAGVVLHLGVEWSMNIPLFEWMAISSFVVFVDETCLLSAGAAVRSLFSGEGGDTPWSRGRGCLRFKHVK